jgi:soluble lytic murein transglycosylase
LIDYLLLTRQRSRGLRAAMTGLASLGLVAFAASAPALASSTAAPDPAEQQSYVPPILSPDDVVLYRKIFALQEKRQWRKADRLIKKLNDKRLLGRVLYQRYMHPTGWRSNYKQLRDWMVKYRAEPGATTIYKLAKRRRPKNHKYPPAPVNAGGAIYAAEKVYKNYRPAKRMSRNRRNYLRHIDRDIRVHLRKGQIKRAVHHLSEKEFRRNTDQTQRDIIVAKIAATMVRYGQLEQGFKLAAPAAERSRKWTTKADWSAALAAWQLGNTLAARHHFEAVMRSHRANDVQVASSAVWAARAALASRQPGDVNKLLAVAATYPRNFYGQIALRQLGARSPFSWTHPPLDEQAIDRLKNNPAVSRTVALKQVGQVGWASKEIRRLFPTVHAEDRVAVLSLAANMGIPSAELSLARAVLGREGQAYDTALYPLPPWTPVAGFTVDRALVYAFMRQESAFKPNAKSVDGARGLMQLMPRTASFIGRDRSLRGHKRNQLFSPEFNVALGQKYLRHLMRTDGVDRNLVKIAAAYNGGPGNLRKWMRKIKDKNDPLLFIESLPSLETRNFIRRVLGNFWIYRDRLGQPTPSLDAIASGQWPAYTGLDANIRKAEIIIQNVKNR